MKILLMIFLSITLSACGTIYNIGVERDQLTGKNICSVSTYKQKDYVTTGNPGAVDLFTYSDYNLKVTVTHFYPLMTVNKTENLKDIQIRIDSNEIITVKDENQDDKVFIKYDQRQLIEQMKNGKKMVLRVNYYNGHTKDFELDLSRFNSSWDQMINKCQRE